MKDKINTYVAQLQQDIPGFIGFSICEIQSGHCVYATSNNENFNIELITACNVDFIRAKFNTLNTGEIDDHVKNIIVNLEHQIHVIDITADNAFFFYLAVSNKSANLAIILSKLAQCKKILNGTSTADQK